MLAFGDELVGTTGVAEIEGSLAGGDGEVGFGHPGAPVGPVGAGVGEVLLRCAEDAQDGQAFVLRCEGAGEVELEEATADEALSSGQKIPPPCDGSGWRPGPSAGNEEFGAAEFSAETDARLQGVSAHPGTRRVPQSHRRC